MSNLEFSVQLDQPATDADECCRQLAAAVRQGGRASCTGGPSNFAVSCALDKPPITPSTVTQVDTPSSKSTVAAWASPMTTSQRRIAPGDGVPQC